MDMGSSPYQLEAGREGQRFLCPADRDHLILERLAQHLHHAHPKFGQFI